MERNIGSKGKERNFANYSNYHNNSYNYFGSYFYKDSYNKRVGCDCKVCSGIFWIEKRSWNEKDYKFKNSESRMLIKVFIK